MNFPEAKSVANDQGVEALCINTGTLSAKLPFNLSADEMRAIGILPHAKIKAGYWWRVEDVPGIIDKLFDAVRRSLGLPADVVGTGAAVTVKLLQRAAPDELAAFREAFASEDIRISDDACVEREGSNVWIDAQLRMVDE